MRLGLLSRLQRDPKAETAMEALRADVSTGARAPSAAAAEVLDILLSKGARAID